MGRMIDEAITRYKNNAEYERTHGNLQGCLEFRQLTKWLEQLQKITEIVEEWSEDEIDYEGHYGDDYMEKIQEVLEDGNND